MASMPPPPGQPGQPGSPWGGPPYGGPQNTRDYWRFQKEQRKAAWRAQRDAWRAQRDVLRAQNRAMRVPSIAWPIILVGLGVIFLLVMTGHIQADRFWDWFSHWWPLMLIGLGLIALAEWAIDLRLEQPRVRHYGGFIWLAILVVIVGTSVNGWHNFWGPLRANFGDNNNDDFFNAFGQPEHDQDQSVVTSLIPANAEIEVQNPRGDISIAVSEDTTVSVKAHQVAYASNDGEAAKIFDSQKARVTVSGTAVLVKVDGNSSGRTNLVISVPRSASVNVNSGHGGVTIAGLGGNVDATVQHGDLETTAIHGHVHAHLSDNGDFSAHDVTGDVTVEGSGGDLTLTDIHGNTTVQGDYSNVHLERADQPVHFHSSRTDLELGRLPGDLSLTMESLHVTEVVGPVRVITHSKDIEMTQVYGDSHIEDKDGRVELDLAGSYSAEVKDNKGDIDITLPPGASVDVDGRTHNGDVVSDFPLTISGDEDKRITGNIGKGGPKLVISTDNADLHLRKGTEAPGPVPSIAAAPKAPPAPPTPGAPGVPHLKSSKAAPVQPVTQ